MAVDGGMTMKGLGVVGFGVVAQLFWSGGLVFDRGRRLCCFFWTGGGVFDRGRELFWIRGLNFDRGKQNLSKHGDGGRVNWLLVAVHSAMEQISLLIMERKILEFVQPLAAIWIFVFSWVFWSRACLDVVLRPTSMLSSLHSWLYPALKCGGVLDIVRIST